jgi:hypothetical protein
VTQTREAAAEPISLWRSWGSACAIFAAVVLFALATTCGVAWTWGGGPRYLTTALVAWGLCWFAALIAFVVVIVGRQLGQGVGAVLIAMGVRMGLPLAAALFLVDQSPFWGETKLMPFLLGNYLVALIAETSLVVHVLGKLPAALVPSKPAAGEFAPKA